MAADDSRSFMDKLPPAVRPVAAALGLADRPLDSRERAREWIVGFLVAADEDRVNCVALLLGAADDAILCAVNHKDGEPIGFTVVTGTPDRAYLCVHGPDELETRDEALVRQAWLSDRDRDSRRGPYVACKVVPLDDEQEQG